MISTGGTDPCHAAESLLSQLIDSEESRDWCFHVLAGPMHSDRKSLEQMALSHPGLRLYEHVAQMAELMQRCDLAVSAAGTTLFELCSAGTPAVSFTMADNQFTTAVQMEAVPEFLMQETSEPQKILPPGCAVSCMAWPRIMKKEKRCPPPCTG